MSPVSKCVSSNNVVMHMASRNRTRYMGEFSSCGRTMRMQFDMISYDNSCVLKEGSGARDTMHACFLFFLTLSEQSVRI
jgi:hypothetical protein